MRIPVILGPSTTSQPSTGPLAWIDDEPFLIELQGELQGEAITQGVSDSDVEIGKLDLTNPSVPILIIGHHRLEGKVLDIQHPYALLKKTRLPRAAAYELLSPSRPRIQLSQTASQNDGDAEQERPALEIVSLVRKRMVFSKRPQPIVHLDGD